MVWMSDRLFDLRSLLNFLEVNGLSSLPKKVNFENLPYLIQISAQGQHCILQKGEWGFREEGGGGALSRALGVVSQSLSSRAA